MCIRDRGILEKGKRIEKKEKNPVGMLRRNWEKSLQSWHLSLIHISLEGLADNTAFWNITAGLAMFFGRYIAIIAQLAIAGSMLAKKKVNETVGTLRTDNVTFMIILVFIVYIFAALTFFPALALGPIAEHLSIWM